MILGPDGKPVRPVAVNTLQVPEWLKREAGRLHGDALERHKQLLEDMRILELRESVTEK